MASYGISPWHPASLSIPSPAPVRSPPAPHIPGHQTSFWNLGSSNDRWLPPDRRRSPRGDFQLSPSGAPVPVHQRAPYASDSPQVLQVDPVPMHSPSMPGEDHSLLDAGLGAGAARPSSGAPGRGAEVAYGYGSRPAAGVAQPPIWAWGDAPQQQQQQARGYCGGAVSAAAPWATDYGGAAVAAPTTRPPSAAAGQAQFEAQAQYAVYGGGYAGAQAVAGIETQHRPLQHSNSQRYGSRPASKPCPFAVEADGAPAYGGGRPQSVAASARATGESQVPWGRVTDEVQGQWGPGAAQGAAAVAVAVPQMDTHAAGEEQAWVAPGQGQAGYAQGYSQAPEQQGQQAWVGRATGESQASGGVWGAEGAQAAPWAAAPSLRYAARPAPQPRPYAYDEQDGPDRFSQPVPASAAPPGSSAGGRPGSTQRFGSRPEPSPCPYAVEASNAKPAAWGPAPEHKGQPFPWL